MSESIGQGPEQQAVNYTRLWMMLISILIAWSVQLILGLLAWSSLGTLSRVLLLVTIPCAVLAYLLRDRPYGQWLLAPLPALPIVCTMLAGDTGPRWISIGTMFSYLGYLIVLHVGQRFAIAYIILWPALLALLWSTDPQNVINGPLRIAGGWAYVFQLGAALFFARWAWQVLAREAIAADAEVADIEQRTRRSLELTERAAVWREAVTRIHETVLNTLRYLLSSPEVDRAQLAEFGVAGVLPGIPERPPVPPPVVARADISTPFDKGRFLITAIIAGNAMGGALYALAFLVQVGLPGVPATLLIWASMLTVLGIVIRRRRLRHPWSILIILIPALAPWVLRLIDTGQCGLAEYISPLVNTSGFCVIVLAAWSGRIAGMVGLWTWAIGSVLVAVGSDHSCATFLYLAIFNSLIALPLILMSTYLSTAAYVRSRKWSQSIRRAELVARSRAEASMDVAEQLSDVIDQAMGEIRAISEGAPVDDSMRAGLRVLDARIRAAMQVDPRSAGAFVTLAQALVDEFAMRGVQVQVRGLHGSADLRDLPDRIVDRIYSILDCAGEGEVSLQCLTDTLNDYLSLVVPTSFLEGIQVRIGGELIVDDVTLAIEETEASRQGAAACAIVISRAVEFGDDSP